MQTVKEFRKFLKYEEPFGFLEAASVMSGLFSNAVSPKNKGKIEIYRCYLIFGYIMMGTGCLLNCITAHDFFEESVEAANFVLGTFQYLFMYFTLFLNQNAVLKMFENLRPVWKELERSQKNVLDKSINYSTKFDKRITTFLLGVLLVQNTIKMISDNLLTSPPKETLPLEIWVPDFLRVHYFFGFFFQMFIFMPALIIYVRCTVFMYAFTVQIHGFCTAVSSNMSKLDRLDRADVLLTYRGHQEIAKTVIEIRQVFKWSFLVEISLTSARCIFPMLHLAKDFANLAERSNLVAFHFTMICINFGPAYFLFGAGNLIETADSLIQSNWHLMNVKERKEFIIASTAATEGMVYCIPGYTIINRKGFTSLLQAIYSYFSMLLYFASK